MQIIRELSQQRKCNFHYWFHAALIVGGDQKGHRRHPFLGPPARERRKTKQRKTNNNIIIPVSPFAAEDCLKEILFELQASRILCSSSNFEITFLNKK